MVCESVYHACAAYQKKKTVNPVDCAIWFLGDTCAYQVSPLWSHWHQTTHQRRGRTTAQLTVKRLFRYPK